MINEPVRFMRLTQTQYEGLFALLKKVNRNCMVEHVKTGAEQEHLRAELAEDVNISANILEAMIHMDVYPASQPDVALDSEDFKVIEFVLHFVNAYFVRQMSRGVTDAVYMNVQEKMPILFWKLKKLKGE